MKELIRKFERESGLEIYGLGARREKWEHCMEKFAELIVKECADICDDNDNFLQAKIIKKHFGVEL